MCVQIHFNTFSAREPFDSENRTITLPAALGPADTLYVVRAILHELAVPQPPAGAVCWCGEDVDLLRVPRQRRSNQVVSHGA